MISFLQYQTFSQRRKAGLLFSKGISLELFRQTPELKVELFALADFYVEIFYDRLTEDPIYLQAFNNLDGLKPYFEQVNIESVLM